MYYIYIIVKKKKSLETRTSDLYGARTTIDDSSVTGAFLTQSDKRRNLVIMV